MKLLRGEAFRAAALLLVSVVVALLIAEFAVRFLYGDRILISPRYVSKTEYGDYRIRRNIPGARYHHKTIDEKWEFRINGSGFRDPREFAYEKPAGVIRILVLGDSFTIGYEVDQEETYAAVLERYLDRRGLEAEVINAGMSGSSNAEELIFFEQEGVKYDPDFVVLGFFRNDIGDNIRTGLFRMEDGELVVASREYLPAVSTRDFLNAIPLYRWVSENSYLHNYLNRVLTLAVKKRMFEKDKAEYHEEAKGTTEDTGRSRMEYKIDLAVAIIERIREVAAARGAATIVVDIPRATLDPSLTGTSDGQRGRIADEVLDSSRILREYEGLAPLYGTGGKTHWTPIAHLAIGMEIGRIIEARLGDDEESEDAREADAP